MTSNQKVFDMFILGYVSKWKTPQSMGFFARMNQFNVTFRVYFGMPPVQVTVESKGKKGVSI